MTDGALQYVLAAGACMSLIGLGLSGVLVSRAQTQRERRALRLASIVAPHLRVARIELAAFASPTRNRNQSVLGIALSLFGFNPDHAALYPTRWWVVLVATFLLAWGLETASSQFMGALSLATWPVAWVMLSRSFFKWVENRRKSKLLTQFPDALQMIVRSIRVGIPVMEAIRAVSREIPNPTGDEFGRLVDRVAIGGTLEDAIIEMARRSDLAEYRFFATAVALQTQTGGTLSETLENLADVIRKRAALKARGHAMTAEARTSSMILAALPFVTGVMLFVLNPKYIMLLFTTPTGHTMFATAIVFLIVGMLTIRAIIRRCLP